MFYDCQNPVTSIDIVSKFPLKPGLRKVAPRGYSSLAFKIKGRSDFKSDVGNFSVGVNDVLYIPQGMGYEVNYTPSEMIVFHFFTQNTDKKPEIYTPSDPEKIYKLFLNAFVIWRNKDTGFVSETYSIFYKILSLLSKSHVKEHFPDYFLQLVSYINIYFREEISISELCRTNGISETTFRTYFKKYYSKTPIDYITDLRLEYARNLIAQNVSISQAAVKSGFNNPKYFARIVKKKLGCTPRDLKEFGK